MINLESQEPITPTPLLLEEEPTMTIASTPTAVMTPVVTPVAKVQKSSTVKNFKSNGVIYYGKYKWTWYSEKVLPGKGLRIPGRHIDSDKFVCDENEYICLASSDLPKGTIIDTPFNRKGKVYDYGCPSGVVDVYTSY